jgi:hypothetical protein
MKRTLLAFIFLPFAGSSQFKTDSSFIKSISDNGLVHGTAYDNLRVLTKQIGGRLAGSPQFAQAVQWGQQTLHSIGADTVYLQECMVPHWVRGGVDKGAVVAVNNKKQKRSLDILALGNSIDSGGKALTAKVLAVTSFDELEKRKNEVNGKIVFYNAAFNPTNLMTRPFLRRDRCVQAGRCKQGSKIWCSRCNSSLTN